MKKFLLILMTCALALSLYAQIPANNAQPCPGTPTVTDKNGNVYNTVSINNQCWMKENMRTTRTATGTSIPNGGSTAWTSGSYYFNYSASSIPLAERGYLYNYSAASQICPTGWHLPSHAEWTAMEQSLSSITIEELPNILPNYWRGNHAGKLAGGNRWSSYDYPAAAGDLNYSLRNVSGFSAVPAGILLVGDGFLDSGTDSYFWTSTTDNDYVWYRNLSYKSAPVNRGGFAKSYGLSVRCLRDKPVLSVVTSEVYNIESNYANCTSTVYSDYFIAEQGVCWSMVHNPTTDDARSIMGLDSMGNMSIYVDSIGTISVYEGSLFGLTLGSTYYVRAYAIILNISGNDTVYETIYGNEVSFNTPSFSCPGTPLISDVEGNTYNTIRIGNRCWMKQNLRTKKKPNGTNIPAGGSSTSYYDPYYYDYSSSNIPLTERGYLYNWQAAYEACPTGWRLPTDAEWTTMEATQTSMDLSGTDYRGDHAGKLAGGGYWNTYSSIPYSSPGDINNSSHNISGFTAVPAGYYNNGYSGTGYSAIFWTSKVESGTPWRRHIFYNNIGVDRNTVVKTLGYSVRCIRKIAIATTFINSTPTSITLSGEVIDDGSVTARGVCWSTNFSTLSIADEHTNDGTGTGTFTSHITGLSPNTTYYVRTYATNSSGTFYSDARAYTTPCPTANVSITGNTTINEGESTTLTASVTGYDMCTFSWSTGSGATSQAITVSPTATTTYTVTATDFLSNCKTTASATVIVAIQPTVTTSTVSNIGTTSATCGGNVTNEGNVNVTARGVCWSTEHNPTIYDPHTMNGSGAGSFTSQITGLEPGVTYYVRAYATNSAGTAYGSEMSLTTVFLCVPEDQCELTFVLTDSYGDGWNGNAILVKDAETGTVLGTMANENLDGQNGVETQTVTLAVCDGRTVNFEWVSGSWTEETSYTVYDGQGEEIFSGTGKLNDTITHTVNCCHIFLNEEDNYTYFEDFESYTASTTVSTGVEPTCWELVREDVTMTDANRPQLYYKNSYAHSGNYSLMLGYRGVYAMPKLAENVEMNEMRMEMYLRQTSANYRLQVGVWEPDGTFVPVATINNSTTNVERVSCDFSGYTGNGRRIAFRNVLGGGANYNYSYNYIDDITLRRIPVNDAKPCPDVPTVTDIDGNVYNTVQLGEQCWMKENLRTTHYADGVEISSGSHHAPNNDAGTVATYGYLYDWSTVMHGAYGSEANPSGVQGICPDGWHLPSDAEWDQLESYVSSVPAYRCGSDNTAIARALSAPTGWLGNDVESECAPGYNTERNNLTGFGVLPAGYYSSWSAQNYGYSTYFWTTSDDPDRGWAWVHSFGSSSDGTGGGSLYKYYAESVRCVLGEGGNVPVVQTGSVVMTSDSTAICEGTLIADGGQEVIARGICWSIYGTPSVSGSHSEEGVGLGTFTSTITGLTPGSKYYVRAYATNATGVAYGETNFFVVPNCRPITCLPYREEFENYTGNTTAATGVEPNCWELVRTDAPTMPNDKRPQLYYNSDFAHSGSYSLKLYNRGVYAMPELYEYYNVRNVRLEMYLRQPKAAYQLEVGVWEDNGTFVPVNVFNNASDGVEYVECDFSSYKGGGGRIAFRNMLGSGNYTYSINYIDDIRLTDLCEDGIMLPYAEDFESQTTSTTAATGVEPLCWELVQEEVPMPDSKRPQIYYKNTFAHSGNYSLMLSNRGVYAMPYLSWDMEEFTLDRVKLEMYLRQPNAAYQLEVGVWDEEEGFIPVQRINNSTTGVEKVTVDFSNYEGWGRRIAFRNVLANGYNYDYSYNYIDDITLTEMVDCSITLPLTESFDGFTESTTTTTGVEPTCWELVRTDAPSMPDDKRPQVYYKSTFAHSGSYSLLMNYRCVYAMPEISEETDIPLNRVQLDMYLRQANAAYQLEVGVWDDVTNTFTPVALFNNTTTGVEHVTCNFSGYNGNGRRIAFRNVLGSGSYAYSYNYLDDITLTEMVDCSITLPYAETFENFTTSTTATTGEEPTCWELVRTDAPSMPNDKRPQVYYRSDFAHSGSYSLLMNYRCVYAMPEISEETNIPLNRVQLDMYLRQANAAYQLEVGVWDDVTNTFTPVALFNNTTSGVEHVTCNFSGYSGNGKRIAFRNVLGSGSYAYSYNYLDDITLTEIEDCSITLPYTETFENFTESTTVSTGEEPTCWELVRTDAPSMPNEKRPQLYYRSDFAHSGSYSLMMNYRCVYAMPEISGDVPMNNVKLDMYLRQPNTAYQLQVGVWDDATNTFEPVALFKNSTNNVTHVECNFSNYSGSGRRVAFRNVLKSGFSYAYSYNYLDDITLTFVTNKSMEVTNANTTDAGMLDADRDMVDVIVYPNPTKDIVNVQCTMNNAQCSGIEIVDVYGKVVRTDVETLRATSLPTQINVSGLAAGMYFVRVTTDKGVVTKPFVKR